MHLLRLAVIILAHGPLGVQAKQLACGQSAFGRCECKSNFIDCRARMLKEVPVSMTPNAEVVDLDLNQIQVIGECDFRGLDLLVELSLYKNQIHSIHIKAFEHLYRLRVLNLRKNSLTILDVNNLNVHHLSSLDTLYLRGNQIVMIDKYTLLSAVMFKFNIEMDNSMIPCDCYLREMRETFLAFSTDLTPYFSGIFCVDGPERFPMLDAAVSVFGQCPATRRTHAFNDVSTACMTCSQAETNHECQLSGTTLCTKPQNACQTVLEWDGESLSISSRCLGYRDCLMAEFTNSQTCVNSSTLFCKFCAFGTMCSNSTPMAGRTLDVNYNLTYAKFKHDFTEDLKDRNSPKFLDFQNNVALALKEITSSLPRGINSRVVSCELVRGKELHVLVNFDLTVINAYSHDAVKNALLKELQLHLHKEGGFFHRENTDVTTVYLWDQGVPNSVLKWKDNPKNPSPSPTTKVCPPSLTENGTVVIFWRETEAGHYDVSSIGADTNRTFYKRKCHENYGVPYWGPVERYELTNKETDMEKDPVSASASIVLEISEQMSPELSRQLLDDLENLTDDVAVPGVAGNLLTASSLMMDVLLQDSAGHVLPSVDSERLLTIIEKTAYNVPLTDGLFRFVKKNVAVAAIAIDSAQISDVRLVINSRSRKDLVDDMIGVDVDSKLQTEETTSLLFALKSIPRERRDKLKMAVFTVFPSGVLFATDYTQSPNSYILSVQIPHLQNEHLDDDVIMTFYHFNDTTRGPSCKYWRTDAINTTLRHKDGRRGKWARDGCRVVRSDQEKTVCSCSHMTNFALIMDVYQLAGSTLDEENIYSLKLISQAGCTISLLGLSFTLLSYTIFSRLRRDEPSKILYSLCWALFLCNGFFVFGAEIDILQSRLGCKFLAAVLHYLLTSSIFWMAVNAYYMYLMLVRVFNIFISHFYIKAACVGWGIPLILVVVTLAIDKTETYGKLTSGICWIRSPAFYFVFVVPVVMVLLFNLTVFCLILRQLSMMARSTATQHSRQERKRFLGNFRAIVSLVVLLGLTWIFAFFAVGHASMLFSYLFAVCNSLQGLLVFLFYCVFKKDVIHAWENLFGLGKESSRQDRFSYTQDPGKTYDENTVSIDRRDTNTFEPPDLHIKTSTRTSGDTIM